MTIRHRKRAKTRPGKKGAVTSRAGERHGWPALVARGTEWVLRAAIVYAGFNLLLNAVLYVTHPVDLRTVFQLGALDDRSKAALLLSKHLLFHQSLEEEQHLNLVVSEVAAAEEIDASLLLALAEVESGLRPHAISPVGACGLCQLMPGTAEEQRVSDPFDPHQNLTAGAQYLKRLLKRFGGNLELALAAYNAGPGAVSRAGGVPPYQETRDYVERVTRRYRQAKGSGNPGK